MSENDSLRHLRETLQAALVPVPAATGLELIGEGFSSRVIVAGDVIIRIPRHREAADRQAAMMAVLPGLQPLLPVPIPAPIATIPAGPVHPFGATVLERLPGVPMRPDHGGASLVAALGHFLTALHAIRPQHLSSPVRGRTDVDSARRAAMTTALPFLRSVLSSSDHDHLVQWWEAYSATRAASRFTPSLIHGDLWYENVLVDPEHTRILGILDWEEMAFDDPAQDFATLRHSGDDFSDEVLASYARAGGQVDDDLLARRDWHWECREITGIATALQTNDPSEIDDALTKLMNGPVMTSRRLP